MNLEPEKVHFEDWLKTNDAELYQKFMTKGDIANAMRCAYHAGIREGLRQGARKFVIFMMGRPL